VWLAGNRHTTALQFVNDSVDAIDAETWVVPARHFVAVMQIRIRGALCCSLPGHQLEMKTIVPNWVKKTKTEPGYGHRLLQSKIKFVGVPGIAVLSQLYLAQRKWTEAEISGLLAREKLGEVLILPIWHGITEADLKQYNLILASRIAKVSDSDNYDEIVRAALKVFRRQCET
jgi:hypothetical protein